MQAERPKVKRRRQLNARFIIFAPLQNFILEPAPLQVYDLTLRHPTLSDFQIAQMVAEEHAITISRATMNRLRHLAKFKFLPPKHCQK
jgi:hypothetical protein